jgi:hypothetical protein
MCSDVLVLVNVCAYNGPYDTTGRRLVGAPLAGNTSQSWRHVTDNRGNQAVIHGALESGAKHV